MRLRISLAALPLFGLGQSLIPADAAARRRYVFWLLTVYVGSAPSHVDMLESQLGEYPAIAAVLDAIYAISRRLGPFTPPLPEGEGALSPALRTELGLLPAWCGTRTDRPRR